MSKELKTALRQERVKARREHKAQIWKAINEKQRRARRTTDPCWVRGL
jgi:hypothetical protein